MLFRSRPPSWRESEPPRADFFSVKAVLAALMDTLRVPWSVERDREPFLHPGRSARVLVGGTVSDDGVLAPTLLVDVDDKSRIVCEEAFGPVVSVIEVDSLDDALARVNASDFGLNTSVYTADLASALRYARTAEAGSVLVNMPPSFRADHMPYGGVKDSGQGTEGVRYAIEELLHHKLVVLKP